MKNVIYITNKEVPYKVEFFNHLSNYCNLKVIYENQKQKDRDEKWAKSIKNKFEYSYLYTNSRKRKISLKLIKYLFKQKNSIIIFGCINSPLQMFTFLLMRLLKKKYTLNLDGEYFTDEKSLKNKLKKYILKNADHYLIAGEEATKHFKKVMNVDNVTCYHFSSLTSKDIELNKKNKNRLDSNKKILIVSRYVGFKGLDVLLQVAKKTPNYKYIFVGVGNSYNEFKEIVNSMKLKNIEIISFLEKKELFKLYEECEIFVLPTLYECWGLVINEAASFGIPIVSTKGSGAAVDFLLPNYKKYLAEPGSVEDLYNKIIDITKNSQEEYSRYLLKKSEEYTIERIVEEHMRWIDKYEIG